MSEQKTNFHDRLIEIQKQYPALTFDNQGYQYMDTSNFSEEEKKALQEVHDILKQCVGGFTKFNNFKPRKDGTFDVRCQADWNYGEDGLPFIGVFYIRMDQFKKYDERQFDFI